MKDEKQIEFSVIENGLTEEDMTQVLGGCELYDDPTDGQTTIELPEPTCSWYWEG